MKQEPIDRHVQEYESRITPARQRFAARMVPVLNEPDTRIHGLFLIYFCSQGVAMTEPVPDWIRRAGEMTRKKGFDELGLALTRHAAHEAGHHQLMIQDTQSLVGWWNRKTQGALSAEIFLEQPMSPGVIRYRQLHEDCIQGPAPYGQITIEYEIEKVSVDWGPRLFSLLVHKLGPDVLQHLSFIREHVAIDVGHTRYNQRALSRFIEQAPDAMTVLVEQGAAALDCYASYLEDCVALARRHLTVH